MLSAIEAVIPLKRWRMVRAKARALAVPIFSVLSLLGVGCAGLSVFALAHRAFQFGLADAMHIIMDFYNGFLERAFGWAEPYIHNLLDYMQTWISFDLHLYGHWKHVFVLIGVYFFRDVSETVRIGRPASAAFLAGIGLPIALAAAIGAGAIASLEGEYWSQFWIASIPVLGVTLYDFLKLLLYTFFLRRWVAEHTGEPYEELLPYFVHRIHFVARIPPFGMGVAGLGALAPVANAGLATLLLLVILLTLHWLRAGALRVPKVRKPGQTWWEAFYGTGPGLLGTAMAGVLLSAAAFLLANAGLPLVGL